MVTVSRAADGVLLWRLTVAGSWLARLRGLIGRESLAAGEGLFLDGTNGVHMLFMRFAIDCVFVGNMRADGSREVVAVRTDLRPWKGIVWWIRGAHGAIEVAAGDANRLGVRPGDSLMFDTTPRAQS
jgi:uncharacterized membrane protein (UPF0127 family)